MRVHFLSVFAASILPLIITACGSRSPGQESSNADASVVATKVQLPPSIIGGHTYRCADNSVVSVDFLKGGETAILRSPERSQQLRMTAPAAGEPFFADGYVVTGSGPRIGFQRPGEPHQECKG